MSIRYFCDVCSNEIVGQSDRVRRKLGDVTIEVLVCNKGTWNGGHVCEQCVARVVTEGEPMPYAGGWLAHESAERERRRVSSVTALPMNAA